VYTGAVEGGVEAAGAMRVLFAVLFCLFLGQFFLLLRRDLQRASTTGQAVLTVTQSPPEAVADGLRIGQTVTISNAATLGRTPGNVVVVPDPTVSESHLRLVYRNGAWWVEDLGSTNGSFVNSQPAVGITRLADGDVIGCGPRVRLRFDEE
jgi:pSer/pThr/pTyr-binding forkhead associated (FHA) protein